MMRKILYTLLCLGLLTTVHAQSICDSIFWGADLNYGQNGSTVSFQNLTNTAGYTANYFWDFGDGQSSISTDPVHTYLQPGIYGVCLYAEIGPNGGQDSCFSVHCDTVFVGAIGQPCDSTAFIQLAWNDAGNNTVVFNSTGNQNFVGYVWNTGDGNTTTNNSGTYTYQYNQSGLYTVCVSAWYLPNGVDTCWVQSCDVATVSGGITNICDSISWGADLNYGQNGSTVSFQNLTNTAGYTANYFWDFGDGQSSISTDPVHTYLQPGIYGVCLYAEIGPNGGQDSCFSIHCDTVFIGAIGQPCDSTAFIQLAWNDAGNNTVVFNSTGNQNFVGYVWNTGDGNTTTSNSGTYTYQYNQPGTYTACVNAWYLPNGIDTCWVQDCAIVTVSGTTTSICDSIPLSAQFSHTTSFNTTIFTDQSNTAGYAANYLWDFGDGNTSTFPNPAHTFNQPGFYVVCLYIEIGPNGGQDSCFASYCDTIQSLPIGIEEQSELERIGVHPNPATDYLQISWPLGLEASAISMIDTRGRKVMEISKTQINNGFIDIRSLESGVYLLNVSSGTKRRVIRIAKY